MINQIAGEQNLHTHTTYVDGALTAEDMVLAAVERGCASIGFSEHSYVPFDEHYSMPPDETCKYIREVNELKRKYGGIIEVFTGLELDYYSDWHPDEGLDYIIGTAHYIKTKVGFSAIDASAKHQEQVVNDCFDGDFYALAEAYYENINDIVDKTKADIVGHFDLVMKYNDDSRLFDERHPRYASAALCAMDEILKKCRLFEVNTGAMYHYGKREPYPSVFLLKELNKRGGEVILSSDSHDAVSICHAFHEMRELLKTCGFKYLKRLTKDGFVDDKLR